MRKTLLISVATLLCASFTKPALADPMLGGQLYYSGGDVTVEVLDAEAGFTSNLYLYLFDPVLTALIFLGENHDTGFTTTFNPGADFGYDMGDELIFGIFVENTGYTFFTGPGSRNPDGIMHAIVDDMVPGGIEVGFEDLFGGGDLDYDDNRFLFSGGLTTRVPEPGTLALLGLGLLGMGAARRRKLI